jgi:SagB-type dehydrogenase family enzyme
MAASLFLSLRDGAALAAGGDGKILVRAGGAALTLKRLTPGVQAALRCLGDGGGYEDPLAERVGQEDGSGGVSLFYHCLQQLGRCGLLLRSAGDRGGPLATLVPTSAYFTYPGRATIPDRPYVLSRFACWRAEGGQVLLESPLAHAHVLLHDRRTAALVHALARPNRTCDAAGRVTGLPAEDAGLVVELLLNADLLGEADEDGAAATDRAAALQSWEFHDLLFHARSREGRHANPVGGTYRFAGRLPPPPAWKPTAAREGVALYRPVLEQLWRRDPPFARVQERRQSIREYGAKPITARQLGEFLYRVGRVKESVETEVETPHGSVRLELAFRPYPGGGALYELEVYVAVNACEGLAPGLYHYDPLYHRLDQLAGRTADVERLLSDAGLASGIAVEKLQVQLVVAARFQRLAWKYASMAYAATLKHVGVLYQTMYLAATAMNLAPCGIGCGDADLFARAAGTDYYAETSVGEFLLGSTP